MKVFNELLKYRSYYQYDFECEVISIADGALHDEAIALYGEIIRNYFLKDDDKWAFDIALDCIHNFTDEECAIISKQGEIFDYHLGYGMYVRNKYIHPSKLHFYLMAEDVSGRVAGFIYTIILPVYNCLNENFMKLLGNYDFWDIDKQYRSSQPIINQMLEQLEKWENKTTADEALQIIIQTIRTNLGRDGFKNIILPIIAEHVAQQKHINTGWKDLTDKLYSKTGIYRKEYNQLRAIKEMGIFYKISAPYPSLKTIKETQAYIVNYLGLSEEDALHMAECAFEIEKLHASARKE